jgi:hypothetical protein
MAALSRIGEAEYELRLYRRDSREYGILSPYAVTFIGNRGKRFGYVQNDVFERILNIRLGRPAQVRQGGVQRAVRPGAPEM